MYQLVCRMAHSEWPVQQRKKIKQVEQKKWRSSRDIRWIQPQNWIENNVPLHTALVCGKCRLSSIPSSHIMCGSIFNSGSSLFVDPQAVILCWIMFAAGNFPIFAVNTHVDRCCYAPFVFSIFLPHNYMIHGEGYVSEERMKYMNI